MCQQPCSVQRLQSPYLQAVLLFGEAQPGYRYRYRYLYIVYIYMNYLRFKTKQAASCRKEIAHIQTHSMLKVTKLYEATPLHPMKSTENFTASQKTGLKCHAHLAVPEAEYLHLSPPASEVHLPTHSANCTNQPDLTLRTPLQ